MNGIINPSDGRHGNRDTSYHDDDLGQLEAKWDDTSDTLSSCSCSSCSTCSLCDVCESDDFPDTSTAATNGFSLSGTVNALSISNPNSAIYRKNDNARGSNKQTSKPLGDETLDDESGIYSSGSDKEMLTNPTGFTKTVKQSSTIFCKAQTPKLIKKKVTFQESSLRAGNTRSATVSGKTVKKNMGHNRKEVKHDNNVEFEYKRLESILTNIDPFKLHSIMKRRLKRKNTQTIQALGKLFPKSRYSGETVHCVRCHKEYSPQFDKKDCYLDHPKSELTITYPLKGSTAYITCSLCKKEYWVQKQKDLSNVNIGHCYVGKHTSCLNEAVYFPHGAAQSCEDRGCIEFYV